MLEATNCNITLDSPKFCGNFRDPSLGVSLLLRKAIDIALVLLDLSVSLAEEVVRLVELLLADAIYLFPLKHILFHKELLLKKLKRSLLRKLAVDLCLHLFKLLFELVDLLLAVRDLSHLIDAGPDPSRDSFLVDVVLLPPLLRGFLPALICTPFLVLKELYFLLLPLGLNFLALGVFLQLVNLFVLFQSRLLHPQDFIRLLFPESIVSLSLLLPLSLRRDLLYLDLRDLSLQAPHLLRLPVDLPLDSLLLAIPFFNILQLPLQLPLLALKLLFDFPPVPLRHRRIPPVEALGFTPLQLCDLMSQLQNGGLILILHKRQELPLHLGLALLHSSQDLLFFKDSAV